MSNIILDYDYDVKCLMREAKDVVSDMIDAYAPHRSHDNLEVAFVHELVRQVFDVMTPDYTLFSQYLANFPNFNQFIGFADYAKSQEGIQRLHALSQSIAHGLFFTLRNEGFFAYIENGQFPFILNQPDEFFLMLQYTGSKPFIYNPNVR